jgi:hypothetical protein
MAEGDDDDDNLALAVKDEWMWQTEEKQICSLESAEKHPERDGSGAAAGKLGVDRHPMQWCQTNFSSIEHV